MTRIDGVDRPGRPGRPDPLPGDEVHVWVVDLAAADPEDLAVLDGTERARAARYRFERDRRQFVASRAALRRILAGYAAVEPPHLRFSTDARGRPSVANSPRGAEFDFNLTHTVDVALVALSACPVGVDVERIDPGTDARAIADHWFSPREISCIAGGGHGSAHEGFFRHWTAKEAYLKARGCGISGLREVELVCAPRPTVRWRGVTDSRRVVPVHVSPSHAACVVTEAVVVTARVRSFGQGAPARELRVDVAGQVAA